MTKQQAEVLILVLMSEMATHKEFDSFYKKELQKLWEYIQNN